MHVLTGADVLNLSPSPTDIFKNPVVSGSRSCGTISDAIARVIQIGILPTVSNSVTDRATGHRDRAGSCPTLIYGRHGNHRRPRAHRRDEARAVDGSHRGVVR